MERGKGGGTRPYVGWINDAAGAKGPPMASSTHPTLGPYAHPTRGPYAPTSRQHHRQIEGVLFDYVEAGGALGGFPCVSVAAHRLDALATLSHLRSVVPG